MEGLDEIAVKTVGIYKVTNIKNGMFYIGSAKDIRRRIQIHRWHLKNGVHTNKFMQQVFDEYGLESFKCEVVEYCEVERLRKREQWWMDHTQCYNPKIGYNVAIHASSSGKGRISSEETRRKIGIARGIPVYKVDIRTGKHLQRYDSIAKAAVDTGIDKSNIGKAIKGLRKSAGGFKWKRAKK